MGIDSRGSLPRNKKQVSNMKLLSKPKSDTHDPLFAIMEQCKKEESQVDPFIRNVLGAPDAMCILAQDRQLNDMVRFCCDPKLFSIVGVDPTFNLGDFSVTVTTYRHLQLLNRSTKKPPVLVGPILVHQRKTMQSYHFLASSLVGLCPDLNSLQAFGTDGEKALGDAFKLQFSSATHLQCFIHVKDCIIRKLRDIGIVGGASKPFLQDIFGSQEGTHLYSGLVDCNVAMEFDENLKKLKDKWNEAECKIRSSTSPVFFDWFTRYQSNIMKETMLRPLRQKAGLGNPPMPYTNNANESANAKIKEKWITRNRN